jgi:hypothetical protein
MLVVSVQNEESEESVEVEVDVVDEDGLEVENRLMVMHRSRSHGID